MQICLTFVQKGPETRLRRYPFCLICLLMGVIVLIPHNNNNSITTKNMLKKTLFANPKKKKTKIGYKWAIFKVTGLNTRELKPNLKLVVPQGFYKRCAFFIILPYPYLSFFRLSCQFQTEQIFNIYNCIFPISIFSRRNYIFICFPFVCISKTLSSFSVCHANSRRSKYSGKEKRRKCLLFAICGFE